MYSIVKGNAEIGITERPNYIRQTGNGTYALCDEADAQGVAYEGVPYHIWGKPEMTGTEDSVALVEFDAGTRIREQEQTIKALLGITTEVITNAE